MLFFGKKKEKEEEEKNKKVLDTNSEKKSKRGRKKKEVPKPWGKKERILLLIVIILTIGVSATLSLNARSWKLAGFPRIKIPRLNLPFFSEETIIIEGDKKDTERSEKAASFFENSTKNLAGVYGFYVVRLSNGSNYGANENETFQAASLIKLPVMIAMYQEFEVGNLDPDTKYSLKQSDKVTGSGSLYSKPAGHTLTYYDLVRLMGKQSDNTAYNICLNLVGQEAVEKVIDEIGMTKTSISDNETSPYDVGVLFEQLWNNNLVTEQSRDEILGFLTDTIYEDHLAAGIPEGVQVAHKYGREVHVINDAGIVFSDEPFVIVIMSKGVIEKEADDAFPILSKGIYDIESE